MEEPYDPNDSPSEPDDADVYRHEAVLQIMKALELQEAEADSHTVYRELISVFETYEQNLTFHNADKISLALEQLERVGSSAKELYLELGMLSEGAKAILNSESNSADVRTIWGKAGGKKLPQQKGPHPPKFRQEDLDLVALGGESPKAPWFDQIYDPSPVEVYLRRLEELVKRKVDGVRDSGKNVGNRHVGDIVGEAPRQEMIQGCLLCLGTNQQDVEKLLRLIRMVHEAVTGPIEPKRTKGTTQWGKDDAARAIAWWKKVGAYWGVPEGETPKDIQELKSTGWRHLPRRKTNRNYKKKCVR